MKRLIAIRQSNFIGALPVFSSLCVLGSIPSYRWNARDCFTAGGAPIYSEVNDMKQTNPFETPFVTELRENIRAFVRECVREGTTAMGIDNLRQCVRTPKATAGAPAGGNVQWQYREIFNRVCSETKDIAVFVLADREKEFQKSVATNPVVRSLIDASERLV